MEKNQIADECFVPLLAVENSNFMLGGHTLYPQEILPPSSKDERKLTAFRLWRQGLPFREVGAKMGYSHVSILNWVHEVLDEMHEEFKKIEDKYIHRELATTEGLLKAMVPLAEHGDYDAVDRVLKILDRRAKYLRLDAPIKIAPTSPDGNMPYTELSAEELRRRIGAVSGTVAPTPDPSRVSPSLS